MGWQHIAQHPWREPLELAAEHGGHDMALLYSARPESYTGQQSFLLLDPVETHEGNVWSELPPLPDTAADGLPYYVGYLGYELSQQQQSPGSVIDLPGFLLTRYARLLRFDHAQRVVDEYVIPSHTALAAAHPAGGREAAVKSLRSNFTRAEYEASIAATLEQIAAGNFYQANITRKFFGSFAAPQDYFSLFQKLCAMSPAPFSAYIRRGDTAIISSSPELFLSVENGTITSRPIKGSAPRGADEAADKTIREALLASSKNRAENLMITDLMRHDIAQVSIPGSVRVGEQSGLYSYPTIHHLVSTVTGEKRADASAYDVVRACFPPGSMTGAPKIAAMRWCAAQERMERGVYSGALGWFGAGERCDLSVVIRTLVCQGERFEFQVGGGIVADSTPEDEWRETLVKARGIAMALGIQESDLEKL